MNLSSSLPDERPEKASGLRTAQLRWRVSVMPEYVQDALASPELDREDLAVVLVSLAPVVETLDGGVAEYGRLLGPMIGHLHLIDSDGSLHDDETSAHVAFGEGQIDFCAVLMALKPVVTELPWWCVDFCFNPQTPIAGKEAVPCVRNLMRVVLG